MRTRHSGSAGVLAAGAALALFCAAPLVRAQDSCSALTHSAAATLLGTAPEAVTGAVAYKGKSGYTCDFTAGTQELIVAVAPYRFQDGWESYAARCGADGQPVPGVGNDSVVCAKPDKSVHVLAHAVDTFFEITLTGGGDAAATREKAVQAARRVAVNIR